jgi:aminoglycoside 3-N-acetyltransferase
LRNGKVERVEYDDIYCYKEEFPTIGASFERDIEEVKIGLIGQAESRLFSLRNGVDYAIKWMNRNRCLNEN